jgi:hypothetical protein
MNATGVPNAYALAMRADLACCATRQRLAGAGKIGEDHEVSTELDRDVRLALFDLFVGLGRAPSHEEVAGQASVTVGEVRESYERLDEQRVVVLDPKSRDVWMANPFSAVPTPFRVRIGERSWFGNCIWDGLGICAMLGGEGTVDAECPDCGETASVVVSGDRPHGDGVAHFVVPAAHFWDDIGFT